MDKLLEHILAMADDAYFMGHPEWPEILKDVLAILHEKQERVEGPMQMPWPEIQKLEALIGQ